MLAGFLLWPLSAANAASLYKKVQYMTGQELAAACAEDSAPQEIYRCLGYISGVIDYHTMLQSLGTNPTTHFCLPEGTLAEEAAIEVLSYLRRRPDQGFFIAAPVVALALNHVYPCPRERQSHDRSRR